MHIKNQTTISHEDILGISKYAASNEEVKEIQQYLKENNTRITETETDLGGGFTGFHVFVDGVDLSSNGFGMRPQLLIYHIRTFPRIKAIMETEEYKQYLNLKQKYKEVDDYIENI